MGQKLDKAENVVRDAIFDAAKDLSRADYMEFLDWLGSEAKCMLDCAQDENRANEQG